EYVPALLDGIGHVDGAKYRRCREDDDIHITVDDLPEVIPSHELLLCRHLVGIAELLLELLLGIVQSILEEIPHRHQDDALGGLDGVHSGACATASATDQAVAQRIRARCISKIATGHQCESGCRRGTRFDEFTPREGDA